MIKRDENSKMPPGQPVWPEIPPEKADATRVDNKYYLLVQKRRIEKEDPYAAERYDPPSPQCGDISLTFDGKFLTMRSVVSGQIRRRLYRAYSGKPSSSGASSYSLERQKTPNVGPIPAGNYWIQPDEM